MLLTAVNDMESLSSSFRGKGGRAEQQKDAHRDAGKQQHGKDTGHGRAPVSRAHSVARLSSSMRFAPLRGGPSHIGPSLVDPSLMEPSLIGSRLTGSSLTRPDRVPRCNRREVVKHIGLRTVSG
jgi:hypothetical protein